MFALVKSKEDIKSEIKKNFKKLFFILIVPIFAFLFYIFINEAMSKEVFLGIVINILLIPVFLSFQLLGIQYSRTPDSYIDKKYTFIPGLNDLSDYVDVLVLSIITSVLTLLWGLLLIIPGIIKGLAYSQAPYIYLDKKHAGNKISYMDAITESRKLMDGYKFNYFLLELSFIGWEIGIISISILGAGMFTFVSTSSSIIAIIASSSIAVILVFVAIIGMIAITIYISFTEGSYYVNLVNNEDK